MPGLPTQGARVLSPARIRPLGVDQTAVMSGPEEELSALIRKESVLHKNLGKGAARAITGCPAVAVTSTVSEAVQPLSEFVRVRM